MIKTILDHELINFELKPGMVVQMQSASTHKIHNMVIAPHCNKLIAIEVYTIGDEITSDKYTRDSYCFIDQDKYPLSLGVSESFGDYAVYVYPHMGFCSNSELIYKVVHLVDGQLLAKLDD